MNVISSCTLSPVHRWSRVKKHPVSTAVSITNWTVTTAATSLKAACRIRHTRARHGTSPHRQRGCEARSQSGESRDPWSGRCKGLEYETCFYPIEGAVRATCVVPADARSSGKLWALRSCITSKPRLARLRMSAHVGMTRLLDSTIL